jgi:hypothetical protein
MAASGADHDGETNGGPQHGRRQLALGHVAQEARTQADGVKGRAIALGGQFVLRATSNKIPVIVRQHLLGACLVLIQIDGVYTHTALRSHVRDRGDSPLWASICHHLTKEKLIIFIVAAKILMLTLRPRPATFPGVPDRATLTSD